MELLFKTKKLEKILTNDRRLQKEFGELATRVQTKMGILDVAPTLAEVPAGPPTRRHELIGGRKNQFAVDINKNVRLIFEPEKPIPRTEDGGIDLEVVTTITILAVEDYH